MDGQLLFKRKLQWEIVNCDGFLAILERNEFSKFSIFFFFFWNISLIEKNTKYFSFFRNRITRVEHIIVIVEILIELTHRKLSLDNEKWYVRLYEFEFFNQSLCWSIKDYQTRVFSLICIMIPCKMSSLDINYVNKFSYRDNTVNQ